MGFDEEKRKYTTELEAIKAGKQDKSKKGGVDAAAIPLLDAINHHPDLYTTSSCAGRILLFVEPASGKKHDAEWLFVSHEEVEENEISAALESLPEETLWFRMEGAILHVCCRTLKVANIFLQTCKDAGWKHSGISSAGRRIIVEAVTSERVDVPIAKEGKLFLPEKFLGFLVKEAVKKLEVTREKIKRLERAL